MAAEDHSAALYALHAGLPRAGPGTLTDTARALARTGLSGPLRVLDMAAGPGSASLELLSRLPEARVTALDRHAPFLAEAEGRVAAAGHARRFATLTADMAAPPVPAGSVDLLWCESAIYILGVETALPLWRPLLAPGGWIVFSDAVWMTGDPPAVVRDFWADYPGMTSIHGQRARIRAAGYRPEGGFVMGEAAWDAYYAPLAARERAVRATSGDTPLLAATRAEIALRETHGETYGYAMFLARPA